MIKPKIIIVDDHKAMRMGLAHLLTDLGNVEITGQASNGEEFLHLLEDVMPDIVLMDINMPVMDGVEATRIAMEKYPQLKILVLSMYSDEEYYSTMINLGVQGFIIKEADHHEIEQAIISVMEGKPYFSQQLLLNLIKRKTEISQISISPREKEILRLLCNGLSSAEIADKLLVSIRTIERTRSDLLLKTDTNNSVALALFAIKNKLVDL
jgi:DNA-binding NarL/FixJ family response regulator